MMTNNWSTKTRIITFTLISISIALLAAFFASPYPDGLDSTVQQLHFAHQQTASPALFSNYTLPFLKNSWLSTGIVSIFGIFFCLLPFYLLTSAFFKSHEHRCSSRKPT